MGRGDLLGSIDLARRFALGQAMRTNGPLARNNVAVSHRGDDASFHRVRQCELGRCRWQHERDQRCRCARTPCPCIWIRLSCERRLGLRLKQVGHDSIVPGTLKTCPTSRRRQLFLRRSSRIGLGRKLAQSAWEKVLAFGDESSFCTEVHVMRDFHGVGIDINHVETVFFALTASTAPRR